MDKEKVDSLELHKAMKFFNLLGSCPFICLVKERNSYHLFTKGPDGEVEELMDVMQNGQ